MIHVDHAMLKHRHADLAGVGADDHHDQLHALNSAADHSGTITDAQHGVRTLSGAHAHADLASVGANDHHREWNWADEQGKIKNFYLPLVCSKNRGEGWIVFASNPVLSPNTGDSAKFDYQHVLQPNVVYRNSTLYLFFAGINSTLTQNRQIGFATSTDLETLTKQYESNPGSILRPTDFRASGKTLHAPSVIYDETDSKWKFWGQLEASDGSPQTVVYAENSQTEPTRAGWTNFQELTLPAEWNGNCFVTKFGAMYYMLAGAAAPAKEIGIFTSHNGINSWTYQGIALNYGTAGAWDDGYLDYFSGFWNQGVFYLLYGGSPSTDWKEQRIGMATSPNFKTFTRWFTSSGQIFDVGSAGAWDDTAVFGPAMLEHEDIFYMYYNAIDAAVGYTLRIGLARLPKET